MHKVFINGVGKFFPGEPIDNDHMEEYLGKINDRASKVRSRILKSNGIQSRHYAIDRNQQTLYSNSEMAAHAIRDLLSQVNLEPKAIDLLAAATTWADLLVPGFGSMVHGEMAEFSPLEVVSTTGVCCAGISALKYAASQVALGEKLAAIAVASEMPSRLFKHTHFEAETVIQSGKTVGFDSEFLRWMLSDGAGAMLLQNRPNAQGISLKVEWIESISHANAYPVCMYAGAESDAATKSWMDYPSYGDAAKAGAIDLRQNIRLLDQVIKLGVEGWLKLIDLGRVKPEEIDWLLCHYSSHFFRGQIVDLLEKAGCMIPEEKWFTNLYTRGNTGCASIYLMLEELFRSGNLKPGQKIFCFVPESGRFTTAYMMLTVVGGESKILAEGPPAPNLPTTSWVFGGGSPVGLSHDENASAELVRQLATVWLEFEREIRSVPLIRKLHRGELTQADYLALLRNLRPQVVEGARWIARAASHMTDFRLRSTFIGHAQEEHRDFQMLEQNYVATGGQLEEIQNAEKNIGSEALSAFIFHQASQENPVDLIGSMFIIEGLGNQLAGEWAQRIRQTLNLSEHQVSFLAYHGANDASHLEKLDRLLQAEWMTDAIAKRIVKTARVTARLYRLQLESIE
jgi:3-oxoacyl-[acyl-carrier-protein] synthase III